MHHVGRRRRRTKRGRKRRREKRRKRKKKHHHKPFRCSLCTHVLDGIVADGMYVV